MFKPTSKGNSGNDPKQSLPNSLSRSIDHLHDKSQSEAKPRARHDSDCTESGCCTPEWKDGTSSGADDLSLSGGDGTGTTSNEGMTNSSSNSPGQTIDRDDHVPDHRSHKIASNKNYNECSSFSQSPVSTFHSAKAALHLDSVSESGSNNSPHLDRPQARNYSAEPLPSTFRMSSFEPPSSNSRTGSASSDTGSGVLPYKQKAYSSHLPPPKVPLNKPSPIVLPQTKSTPPVPPHKPKLILNPDESDVRDSLDTNESSENSQEEDIEDDGISSGPDDADDFTDRSSKDVIQGASSHASLNTNDSGKQTIRSYSGLKQITKDDISGPIDNKLSRTEKRGYLNKTKYMDNGRKVEKKKWQQSYVVLTGLQLIFYKDSKAAQPKPNQPLGKPEITFNMENLDFVYNLSEHKNASTITKRKNVIKLEDRGAPGCCIVYLLQANSTIELDQWKWSLKTAKDWVTDDKYSREAQQPQIRDRKRSNTKSKTDTSLEDKASVGNLLREFFRKRPTKESLEAKGILKNEPVFGSTLDQICENEKSRVPIFVSRCISAIEARGVENVGIYRVSGNGAVIQKLRCTVDQTNQYDLNSDNWDFEVLTNALKLFFRELKQPLIPFKFYEPITTTVALRADTPKEEQSKLHKVKKIIHSFPDVNYNTCQVLFQHLYKVVARSSENQMQASNIAIVFGPNLLWPEVDSDNITMAFMNQGRVVEYLLTETTALFGQARF